MFQLVVFFVTVVVATAKPAPVYTGGMGYGGASVGTVSVTRTTDVVSPGIYSTGMIGTPSIGVVSTPVVTSGVYGSRSFLAPIVEEKVSTTTVRKPLMMAQSVQAPVGEAGLAMGSVLQEPVETVVEKEVDIEVGGLEKRSTVGEAPLGEFRHAGGMGLGGPGLMGAGMGGVTSSRRTDIIRPTLGGVQRSSVGQTVSSGPLGGASVSTFHSKADRIL